MSVGFYVDVDVESSGFVVSISTAAQKYGVVLRDSVKLKGKDEDLKDENKVKQVVSAIGEYQLAKYLIGSIQQYCSSFDDPEYGQEYQKRSKRFEASYNALSPIYAKTGLTAVY